jgi:hypothetical protein
LIVRAIEINLAVEFTGADIRGKVGEERIGSLERGRREQEGEKDRERFHTL